MKKFIGILSSIIALCIIGFSVAILDVGSVSGVKLNWNIEEEVKKMKDKEERENEIENIKKEELILNNKENVESENSEKDLSYNKKIEEIIKKEIEGYDFDISVSFRDLKLNEPYYFNNRNSRSASSIKPFIMVEVYNQISYGFIKVFDELELKEEDKALGDGILKDKEVGSKYTIKELVNLMISKSDNTATNMLIDLVGMDNINRTIESLGFKETVLRRKMMDEDKKDEGIDNYTSVKDLDLLFKMLYSGECLKNEYDKVMVETLEKSSESKLLKNLPNDVKSANKVGDLRGVENDGGIIFTKNGDYIINILVERTSKEDGEEVISNISEKIYFEFMNRNKL